jgi:hypothetical protein
LRRDEGVWWHTGESKGYGRKAIGSLLALNDDALRCSAGRLDLKGHMDNMARAREEIYMGLGLEEDDQGLG